MRKSLVSLSIFLPFLSGCAMDAGYLLAKGLDTRPTVAASSDIEQAPGQSVYAAEFNQVVPMWTDGCIYRGIWVDYVRDWDVLAEDQRVLFAAEPNKSAGYALLIYHATCPGKAPEAVLLTGDKRPYPFFNTSHVVLKGHSFLASNYWDESRRNDRPRWMAQVIKTIQEESPSNQDAQKFLQHVQIEHGLPTPPTGLSKAKAVTQDHNEQK